MTPKVYKSTFRTGPDATKKQQMLFATDTEFAISEGYTHIEDSEGTLFFIMDEVNLVQVESADELLEEPEEVELDCDEEVEDLNVFVSEHTTLEHAFFDDVATAFEGQFDFIEDSEGTLFGVVSDREVTIVINDEECNEAGCDDVYEDTCCPDENDCCSDCDNEETPLFGCGDTTSISSTDALRKIIDNTLNQSEPIRPQQADTILKLTHAVSMLQGMK